MVRRVSGLANDKAVSSCLDDFDRDNLDVVDAQGELAFHIGHVRQRLHAHSLRHKAPQKLRQIIPQTTGIVLPNRVLQTPLKRARSDRVPNNSNKSRPTN